MDVDKILKVREALSKLKGSGSSKKRRRVVDTENIAADYIRALLTPHTFSGSTPDIPFPIIKENIYNIEGNPPLRMLEVKDGSFEMF